LKLLDAYISVSYFCDGAGAARVEVIGSPAHETRPDESYRAYPYRHDKVFSVFLHPSYHLNFPCKFHKNFMQYFT
jgi:hypothetical protein